MKPTVVGPMPSRGGTPDVYVTVRVNGMPDLRVDVWAGESRSAFEEVEIWHPWLVIGFGAHVHLVNLDSHEATAIDLGCYFGHLYPVGDALLVASAERLLRVERDGSVRWRSEALGVDGVLVDDVTGNLVTGRAEHDPPGGWRPFLLALDTGRELQRNA